MTDSLREALQEHFGFDDFQPGQRPIIESVVSGKPTLAIMPTGAGKSLCYQLPALMFEGLTIVVSPLIALMKDQVDALNARGIRADLINSSRTPNERDAVLAAALSGSLDLLYVAPERFGNTFFRERINGAKIALLAIDEAHCISRWGHDFRPDYRRLGPVIESCKPERVLACTATATPEVREDIARSLNLDDPAIFVSGFLRTNLMIDIRFCGTEAAKRELLIDFLTQGPGAKDAADPGGVIIYAPSRKLVESLSALLTKQLGEPVLGYHAGMEASVRDDAQDRFIGGEVRVVVATNAFGMGVDRSDVRGVVHVSMPRTVEGFYQEIGRGGRDRKPAWCLMLTNANDTRIHEFLIEQGESPEHREAELDKLARMKRFVHSSDCRHKYLLTYFGEEIDVPCPGCTRCQRAPRFGTTVVPVNDGDTDTIRKALAGVARAKERYGLKRVAGMLAGSKDQTVVRSSLVDLTTYGLLAHLGVAGCEAVLRLLTDEGLCALQGGEYPLLGLTALGSDIMLGNEEPDFGLPNRLGKAAKRRTSSSSRRSAPAEPPPECDQRIVTALRAFRTEKAGGKPAYTVFTNATLYQIAAAPPEDEQSFLALPGLGKAKWKRFGHALIEAVQEAQQL
ncbi:MAG: ATP-dependent DNA helicase RecQ [Bradymonadia bacterium]|jgi:ATP-dependent DNA helicase RecQ